jgi:hypothetical protein
MNAVTALERPTAAWVVCFGASQPIDGGRVACPLEGRTVPIVRCLDCHYLAAVADERRPDRDCQIQTRID